ncbi:MAG: hypothetical protein KBT34_12100 [Prevotella sp.]|nr:hypothetical protein [Candidatus Prevotella equi]
MRYNKEYIEQVLKRFMHGETTEQEEQFLAEYFSTNDSIPEEWEAYREMFASFFTDAYDFTEEELNKFVKEEAPKLRTISLWPWLAAACVAALMVIFLAPPRGDSSLNREDDVIAEAKKDSMNKERHHHEPITTTDKQIAQATKHKGSSVQEQSKVSPIPRKLTTTASLEATRQEPDASVSTDLAMVEEPKESHVTRTSNVSEDWDEAIEQEFRASSAPIRMRGQQVIQRVAMMQAAHRNQPQYVEM